MPERRRTLALLLFAAIFSVGQKGAAAPQKAAESVTAGAGVAERRLAHLRRGINVSDWFAQVSDARLRALGSALRSYRSSDSQRSGAN